MPSAYPQARIAPLITRTQRCANHLPNDLGFAKPRKCGACRWKVTLRSHLNDCADKL